MDLIAISRYKLQMLWPARTQVAIRLAVHGGKPGPVLTEAISDPDSTAIDIALLFVDLYKLSVAAVHHNLCWTAAFPERLLIWEDAIWRTGADHSCSCFRMATSHCCCCCSTLCVVGKVLLMTSSCAHTLDRKFSRSVDWHEARQRLCGFQRLRAARCGHRGPCRSWADDVGEPAAACELPSTSASRPTCSRAITAAQAIG